MPGSLAEPFPGMGLAKRGSPYLHQTATILNPRLQTR
jgi:hypothetical protein